MKVNYKNFSDYIPRQPKHHQHRTRSETAILLEIILSTLNVRQYHLRLKSLLWLEPLVICYAVRCAYFSV